MPETASIHPGLHTRLLGLLILLSAPAALSAQGPPYTFTRIADTVTHPDAQLNGVYCVGLNNAGTLVVNTAGATGVAVWRGDGGGPLALVASGVGSVCSSINDFGDIAYAHEDTSANVFRLVKNSNGALSVLARSDQAPYLSRGEVYLPSLSSSGFAPYLAGGVYIGPGGQPIVNTQTHPQLTNWSRPASMNENLMVVFNALRVDNINGSRWGIYVGSTLLVEDQTTVNGAPLLLAATARPVINNTGTVAFKGSLGGVFGVYTTSDGASLTRVSYPGAPVHDQISINSAGTVAYKTAGSNVTAIYTGPNAASDYVIGTGAELDGSTVVDVFMWEEGLNDAGQIAFWASLQDGRRGIYRADPNQPPQASNGTLSVLAGQSASGVLTAADPEGHALAYRIVTNADSSLNPSKGSVVITDSATGSYTYTAAPNASGLDAFTFRANDGRLDSNDGVVVVTIDAPPSCVSDVTSRVALTLGSFRIDRKTGHYFQKVTLRNSSNTAIPGPVWLVLDDLSAGAIVVGATGATSCASPAGSPYVSVNVGADGLLASRERANVGLEFTLEIAAQRPPTYTPRVLAGPGNR